MRTAMKTNSTTKAMTRGLHSSTKPPSNRGLRTSAIVACGKPGVITHSGEPVSAWRRLAELEPGFGERAAAPREPGLVPAVELGERDAVA